MSKLVLKLFINFLQIGSFSIGGGYAIIPLIQEKVVNTQGWLTIQEYTDIITISQMTPGPLVVNTASFVGVRIAGILGAIVASIGSIFTGSIIAVFLYKLFQKYKNIDSISSILKGLLASSIGLIASAAATILLLAFTGDSSLDINISEINILAILIFFLSLFFLRRYRLNPILIIILTGITGLLIY